MRIRSRRWTCSNRPSAQIQARHCRTVPGKALSGRKLAPTQTNRAIYARIFTAANNRRPQPPDALPPMPFNLARRFRRRRLRLRDRRRRTRRLGLGGGGGVKPACFSHPEPVMNHTGCFAPVASLAIFEFLCTEIIRTASRPTQSLCSNRRPTRRSPIGEASRRLFWLWRLTEALRAPRCAPASC